MDEGIIKTAPDREKAKSILKMVETTLEMIDTIDSKKFPSHVVKEYYEAIRELITVIPLLDGYKTHGEGAHKKLIEYIEKNYAEFKVHDITLIDDLRIIRNKISSCRLIFLQRCILMFFFVVSGRLPTYIDCIF